MAQPSYYTCNDQPILLSHRYPSPKLDASLPPLSHLLTIDNNTNNNPLVSGEGYYSTQLPASTVLANTDASLAASVNLFDPIPPSVTTTDTTTATGYALTSAPLSNVSAAAAHPMQNTASLYMNDPATAAAAAAMTTAATMMYGPTMLPPTTTNSISSSSPPSLSSSLSSSTTSSAMDPLLLSAAAAVTANTGLNASVPYFYPITTPPSAPYNNNNNTTTTTTTITRRRQDSISSSSSSSDKVYSFVSIPGMDQRKRPRRRYDEIERLYHCTFAGCKKSYGTLNHLNSHVLMQSHGPKRHPSEFKEMRKEWRRQRKQRDQHKKQAEKVNNEQQPTLTTAFQPPPPTFVPSNFSLQSMPLPGFY